MDQERVARPDGSEAREGGWVMAVYEDDAGGAGAGDAAKPAADASSTHGPPFPAGTVVRRRAAPDQVGLVREVP